MSGTKEYVDWLLDKYGEDGGEDLSAILGRLGEKNSGFPRSKEFMRDVLAATIERYRDQPPEWDAFVSFAGEHRDAVAVPLTARLRELGLKVWLDADEYPGEGQTRGILRRYIDGGIARSRIGVVIISPEYEAKEWTALEYFGLQLKGTARLFFVLHDASSAALKAPDSELAQVVEAARGRVASTWKNSLKEIARQVADFVKEVAASDGKAP